MTAITPNKADCIRLIARQLATSNGQVFDKLDLKKRNFYITLAGNITATVERKMVDFRWQ